MAGEHKEEEKKPQAVEQTQHEENHDEEHEEEVPVKDFIPREYLANRYKLPQNLQYVKEPITPLAPPTDYDSTLFADLKVRQVPNFLWQHKGKNGWLRFVNYFDRRWGGIDHTSGGLKRAQAFFLSVAFFYIPVVLFEREKFNEKVKTVIENKFGTENYNKMHEIDKKYYWVAIARKVE